MNQAPDDGTKYCRDRGLVQTRSRRDPGYTQQERRSQQGGTLSGGEQQMLAIGRALMGKPRLLLLDEPSMGLAPMIVTRIFQILREINSQGTTVLLVEQNAAQALRLAARGYVLETGTVAISDSSDALLADNRVRSAYLGEATG